MRENKVREAAAALHQAIIAARAAGYVVGWPTRPEDLPAIAISATDKVAPEAPKVQRAPKPRAQ